METPTGLTTCGYQATIKENKMTKQQIAAKAKELAEILLSGGEFKVGNSTVTNAYFINNVRATDELGRLLAKSGRGESTDIELKQLLEDEASKIADCWAVDVLEMEQEK